MYAKYKSFREKHGERKRRQAGRRYELYVAETLRAQGWVVYDNGALGIHDLGIDLTATKDGVTRYIQCKGLNQNKLIHEDVVSHLFGSVADREGVDNLAGVEIYLYSSAQLDEHTRGEVERLNIHFEHLPLPKENPAYRSFRHYRDRRPPHRHQDTSI